MNRKPEKVKNYIYRQFQPIIRHCCDPPQNFIHIFAMTNTTTYFQKRLIDIFLNCFLAPMTLQGADFQL